ncbi:hypothetical protein EHS25_003456 [Saitozyma podzolica]|uniref:Tyrosine specific protein phosphatases domain-containing protein n=1 Tax=Saitozyma podzolica TaxID=1890683 RepID=A0A427Y7A9_9TREE|nr:hypothetical protein EHS25_003456 [Saitozyma podzolica]
MPISPQSLQHVYHLLTKRESARASHTDPFHQLTHRLHRHPAPEEVFYSVHNSLKYRTSNRYSNILAYDRTAVQVDGDGYLNANVVCDGKGSWWVASQAPVPGTFHPFLRAIYTGAASTHPAINRPPKARPEAALLVQLTGWEENGVTKADRYIPNIEPGETYAVPNHHTRNTMVIQSQTRLRKDDLSSVITQLLLYSLDGSARTTVDESELRKDEAMTVWHYHFDAWPDHGVPEGGAVDALRRLILEIARRREELGDCEVWVHCSAGVGRTGAFIALSSLLGPPPTNPIPQSPLGQSPLGPLPAELRHDAVAQTIDGIREWRGMLVQNQDQMRLVYDMAKV